MPLALPDVTLCAIDCRVHELTRMALDDTLREITPAEVIVWSDRRQTAPPGALHVPCALDSFDAVARVAWYDVPVRIRTSHFLLAQWDGWAFDATCWNPQWLETDLIGAPWWWQTTNSVGNGGFTLRSRRLMQYLRENQSRFPIGHPEDDLLCREYRPTLERRGGFVWATVEQAGKFSFEHLRGTVATVPPTFGFHGIWNWPRILSPDALAQRIAATNPYVRSKPEWAALQHEINTRMRAP